MERLELLPSGKSCRLTRGGFADAQPMMTRLSARNILDRAPLSGCHSLWREPSLPYGFPSTSVAPNMGIPFVLY